MDSQTIHIAFASDAEGSEGLAITGFSALENSSRPVHFWIIEDGIPKTLQRELEALWSKCSTYVGCTFVPMASLPEPMPKHWIRKDWPLTAAARFQLAEVLPSGIGRCIYMDIDILVGTDLTELYDLDMRDQPIGMVLATGLAPHVHDYLRSIALDPAAYCNSGVILINLDAWRAERAGRGLIECGLSMPSNIWFFDQDMLNTYFKGRCLLLEPRWNFRDAGVSPIGRIQHFAGQSKPWNLTPATAVLAGHVAWHQTKQRSGFKARPVPAWLKLRKRAVALAAKLQRRLMRS